MFYLWSTVERLCFADRRRYADCYLSVGSHFLFGRHHINDVRVSWRSDRIYDESKAMKRQAVKTRLRIGIDCRISRLTPAFAEAKLRLRAGRPNPSPLAGDGTRELLV